MLELRRYSREKELILETLRKRTDLPTAEKLFMELKKEIPQLTLSGVHRLVEELCEEGEIVRVRARNGSDRYDGNKMPHIHLTCRKCKEVINIYLYEMQIKRLENELGKMLGELGCMVYGSTIEIDGICEKCAKKA